MVTVLRTNGINTLIKREDSMVVGSNTYKTARYQMKIEGTNYTRDLHGAREEDIIKIFENRFI